MKGSREETIERVNKCKEWTRKQFPKLFLRKLANKQLQNLLKELQTHLHSGGGQLMKGLLKEVND